MWKTGREDVLSTAVARWQQDTSYVGSRVHQALQERSEAMQYTQSPQKAKLVSDLRWVR